MSSRTLSSFYNLFRYVINFWRVGERVTAWYGSIAAMIFFVAMLEAVVFAVDHFKRIRKPKNGWRQRLTPRHVSWITQNSYTMRVIEPVLVAVAIICAGFSIAFVWPFWMPFVLAFAAYDGVQCGIHKWKVWRGYIEEEEDDDDDDDDAGGGGNGDTAKYRPWIVRRRQRRPKSHEENGDATEQQKRRNSRRR